MFGKAKYTKKNESLRAEYILQYKNQGY